MGLATIDPRSHNVQTKLYKTPKPIEYVKIYKEM